MKSSRCLLIVSLLLVLPGVHAAESADALWARIEELQKAPAPVPAREGNKTVLTRDYLEATARRGAETGDALLEFATRFPEHPRHVDAVIALTRIYRPVFREIGDVRDKGWEAAKRDEAAERAWGTRVDAIVTQMLARPNVPEPKRETVSEGWVSLGRAAAGDGETTVGSTGALAEFRRRLDEHRGRYPQSLRARPFEWQYLNRLRKTAPAAVDAHLAILAQDPNPEVAAWAHGEAATERLRRDPLELAFTAVDGREIDFAKLRGKVVLLDFWATWCGPCIAEIPNVKAVYDRYHDKGFEVIAVSLDRKGDRQKLVDFVQKEKLPWPQHFELNEQGRNVLSVKYGVMAIPAMFLLDQEGRLVTTNARGPALEQEVKRLLKL